MAGRAVSDENTKIGQRLRLMRNAAKVSQIVLGQELGVTFQQIQKYEKGLNRLPAPQLYKAAAALKCSVNDILGGGGIDEGANGETAEIMRVLSTREGMEMARAFQALSEPRRRAVITLMREFAG